MIEDKVYTSRSLDKNLDGCLINFAKDDFVRVYYLSAKILDSILYPIEL